MKKVLTTTEFVLWLKDNPKEVDFKKTPFVPLVCSYAMLMVEPLSLSMFVPCDDDGEAIEYYQCDCLIDDVMSDCENMCNESPLWNAAVDNVLFEGCVLIANRDYLKEIEVNGFFITWGESTGWMCTNSNDHHETIEDIARQIDLTPTESFKTKIGL